MDSYHFSKYKKMSEYFDIMTFFCQTQLNIKNFLILNLNSFYENETNSKKMIVEKEFIVDK